MQQDLFADEFPVEKLASALPVIKKGKVKLTPAQSEFNRLNKKIASLKEELNNLPEKKRKVGEFYQQAVLPVMREYNNLLIDTIAKLDVLYDKKELCDDDLFTLSGVILDKCHIFIQSSDEAGEENKKKANDLIRKHEIIQTGLSAKELDKQKVKEMLQMFTMMTGVKPTAKMKKAKTEEELSGLIEECLEAKMREEFEGENTKSDKQDPFEPFGAEEPDEFKEREEPRRKKKMTQTELKRKMQEEQTQKSIRTIYMELVKELHPDREQDEEVRAIKEEQMKQLTEAYKNKDLSALLTMQITWLQESVKVTPGELSDVVLKGYNKVLKTQLAKLEEEQRMNIYSMQDMPEEMCEMLLAPIYELDLRLNSFLQGEQSGLADMQRICKSWCSKRGLKKLIKEYQEVDDFDDFFDDFLDDENMRDAMDDLMKAMISGKMKF